MSPRRAVRSVTLLGYVRAALLLPAALACGCTLQLRTQHPLLCPVDAATWVRDTLYFGSARSHGDEVTAAQWDGFARDVLTKNFPRGFTTLAARGHWRDTSGAALDEATHVVMIDHVDDAASDAAVRRVAAEYRHQFDQQAVLRERSAVCVWLGGRDHDE